MQCNRNAMNTRVIRGNQYTQDMMDPRGFIMDQGECNYDNFAVSQPLPPQPPQPPIVQCNCQCNNNNDQTPKCPIPYEPAGTDSTYSSCSTLAPCAGNAQCCIGLQAQPITSANCMPYIIRTYKVSDAIKFDRVATGTTAVLATGGTQAFTTGITVTGDPIPVGTFKLNITEVCFGDSTVTLAPGATTVAGKALTPTSVFTSSHNLLNRSSVSTAGLSSCCQQCMGTTLDYSQAATTATVTAPAGADPANSINVVLKGTAGCSNVQIATTINATAGGIALTYEALNGSLCRAYNMDSSVVEQYYQSKLSLSCVEATIQNTNAAQNPYTVTILKPVYLQLLLRTTVSLLGYALISVVGAAQAVQARDVPVVAASDFNFDGCF